jgi:hypothetical protein
MSETSKSPGDDIRAGDKVMHRESGKQGTVIEVLDRSAGWQVQHGDPQVTDRVAWMRWAGDKQRTAVPVADLIKTETIDGRQP